jgi:hypothetical protein
LRSSFTLLNGAFDFLVSAHLGVLFSSAFLERLQQKEDDAHLRLVRTGPETAGLLKT